MAQKLKLGIIRRISVNRAFDFVKMVVTDRSFLKEEVQISPHKSDDSVSKDE